MTDGSFLLPICPKICYLELGIRAIKLIRTFRAGLHVVFLTGVFARKVDSARVLEFPLHILGEMLF